MLILQICTRTNSPQSVDIELHIFDLPIKSLYAIRTYCEPQVLFVQSRSDASFCHNVDNPRGGFHRVASLRTV